MRREREILFRSLGRRAALIAILRNQVVLHCALKRAERMAAEKSPDECPGTAEFAAKAPSMYSGAGCITRFRSSDANGLISGRACHGKEGSLARLMYCH